jgi:primosomal protein N' (replication factor Y) (superfamily II helicase)
MMKFNVVKVAISAPLHRLFDYLPPKGYRDKLDKLAQGMRVKVPFGRREVMGFIIRIADTTELPQERLKPISTLLDTQPLLPPSLMQLLLWISQYYHYPLGEILAIALPTRLRRLKGTAQVRTSKKTRAIQVNNYETQLVESDPVLPTLNSEQKTAFEAICKHFNQFGVFLLEGVTGSGKTEVYLRLIQQALAHNQQVLLLVPEISLTPQMVARLQKRLDNNITLFHSGLTDTERFISWKSIQLGEKSIMVGTRSAVFTPFKRLGLIIIDEEQDSSFKQQSGLLYHARDVAIMRARLEKVPIVLGSATPALESLWNAAQGRYRKFTLPRRAGASVLPTMQVIDLRQQQLQAGLSQKLISLIGQHLKSKSQVLLFLNRRGFAPIYLCHDCGWTMMCTQCDSPLRLHHRPECLRCHYCETVVCVPTDCPACNQQQLFALGQGTQKLEKILAHHFPDFESIRIDSDSTRGKGQLQQVLLRACQEKPCILIGTQILAKGHHFPHVSLAAVVEGDAGLFGTDFRSLEQSAQLITQVGGRAGRGGQVGQVVIQTYHPGHPLLNQLITKGYTGFSQLALQERKRANWPPFSYLALLRVETRQQQVGLDFLRQVKENCRLDQSVVVLGPIPSLLTKRAGYHRTQLLFRAINRLALHQTLQRLVHYLEATSTRHVRYSLEIDPLDVC